MSFAHLPPGARVVAMLVQQSWYLRLKIAEFRDLEEDPDRPDAPLRNDDMRETVQARRARRESYYRMAGAAAWRVTSIPGPRGRVRGTGPDRAVALAIADGQPRARVMADLRIGRGRYERVRRDLEAKIQEEMSDAEG